MVVIEFSRNVFQAAICLYALIYLQMLDTLLTTLIREMQTDACAERRAFAKEMARRFVRSVARIFVVLSIELSPQSGKKKV